MSDEKKERSDPYEERLELPDPIVTQEMKISTAIVKGLEYDIDIKRMLALEIEKRFRIELVSFQALIHSSTDLDEIKQGITTITAAADRGIHSLDEWISLLQDPLQAEHANYRRKNLIETGKIVHKSAWDRLQQIENIEVDSLMSQKTKSSQRSQRSKTSRKSSSSASSYKENLVEMQAKKAALREKMKFSATIAEQQQKLEQLKLQQELETINAQEAIYQKAVDEDNILTNPMDIPAPVSHIPPAVAIHINKTGQNIPASPAPKMEESEPQQEPPITGAQTTNSYVEPPCTTGFAGNPPLFIPCKTQERTNSIELAETFIKMSQLHRLPQAKPSVFRGDEKDKTRFFLWQTAFDALIGSTPVTPEQKLHLLYQYLDGRAKTTVEQLQYMVQDPEKAYQHARTILKDRFGNNAILGADFEKRLTTWPKINPNDPTALEEFSDFLQQVVIASEHINSLKVFDFPSQIQLLVEKLPSWFKAKWSDKIVKLQREKGKDAFPSFKEFAETVKYHAERMNIPQILSSTNLREPTKPPPRFRNRDSPIVNLVSKSNEETDETQMQEEGTNSTYCFYHKRATHASKDCEQLQRLSFNERKEFVMRNRLCFNCLSSNQHIARNCKEGKSICKICRREHATALHNSLEHSIPLENEQTTNACAKISSPNQKSRSCARIVLLQVFHQDHPSSRVPTYAVLDDQSTDVFITNALLDQLRTEGQEVNLEISTILGTNTVRTKKVNGLRIQDIEGQHQPMKIPHAYSREAIPANQSDIATPETASNWEHLEKISRHLHYRPDLEIGMLIGRNVPTAFQPLRIIYGKEEEPWAEEYKFGWTIIGRAGEDIDTTQDEDRAVVNRVTVCEEGHQTLFNIPSHNNSENISTACFATKCNRKDTTSPQQIREMMQLDYNELHYGRTVRGTEEVESVEDQRFTRLLSHGIHQNSNGNWEMPLPFKTDEVSLPNNYEQCLKRLISLKKKLKRDARIQRDYLEFMQKVLDRKHADRVPKEELKTSPGKVWYLPHFQVYHPRKPDQIRVVFDCSATFHGESLNQHLLQGPDWMNALVGVLSRFRKNEVAVTCDIEQMFHSFFVDPEHRDFLRFLWFENNDLNRPIVEYRMNVHLFSAVSSPAVSNFGLKATAEKGREIHGQDAANFLEKEFYVDDGLTSFDTPENAIAVIKKSQAMCAASQLRLHKFASNSKEVLQALPPDDRAKTLKNLDLRRDILPVQRSLGTFWCMETDTFGFRIELKDKPCTRRGILATISSVYDPLGIAAPVILVGKQILQDMCRDSIGWDDPVSDETYHRWQKWRSELSLIRDLKMNRCFKPSGFGEPVKVQVHSFSDASERGLGEVSYLRLTNTSGQIHVSFLMAKTRVAPIKMMSIPRLELTAAVISVNVSSMLTKELAYDSIEQLYHTDSTVVLGYIHNDARRFNTFVGNRVQHIRDRSEPDQWYHVAGNDNPADKASRGLTPKELVQDEQWLRGPHFLWDENTTFSNPESIRELQPDDAEVKNNEAFVLIGKVTTEKAPSKVIQIEHFNNFSSLQNLKRGIARIQRVIRKKESGENDTKTSDARITVEELRLAEVLILKSLQQRYFKEEIEILQSMKSTDAQHNERERTRSRNQRIKASSSLYRLDPFLDNEGILRVGGRLHKATTPFEEKHPAIIPKSSHITTLLIRQVHGEVQRHQGRGMTHNAIRQAGYWIINGRSAVFKFIAKCVKCRKLRGATGVQKMAIPPEERVKPSPPFTYTGMDVFGPWMIKEGRKQLKRWGLIFTCLASRGVHLETLNTMETDSFINPLRRFISRRGKVRQLRSDQGSNFMGARTELKRALGELSNDAVNNFLLSQGCDWIEFKENVPHASHMGGLWERPIRTVRQALAGILVDHGSQLDDEALRTLMTEAENIVNSRPLSVENLTDPDALEPITPNHLLTLKSQVVLPPPGKFSRPDLYSRKRWRRVQYLADQFWKRWQREYNASQTSRQKWNNISRNFEVGDIVILREENVPRNQWPLAKVTQVYPSEDDLVRKVELLLTRDGDRKLYRGPSVR